MKTIYDVNPDILHAMVDGFSSTSTKLTAGSVLFVNSAGQISQDNAHFFWDATNQQLLVGSNVPIATSGVPIQGLESNAASVQSNVQNSAATGSASSDHVCTADNGTNSTNYVDMGINSSGYNDAAYTSGGADDSYLQAVGGHLTIITATATKAIKFFTGGTLLANLRATLSDTFLTLATGVGLVVPGQTKFGASVRYNFGSVITTSGATLTLTGAQMAAGTVFQETGTTAATFTLDTGTALSTAIPGVAVGDTIEFMVSNASSLAVTMAGATGTTLANVMVIPTLTSRIFWAVNTGANTWTIY